MIAHRDPADLAETFKEFSLPTTPPATDYYLVNDLLKAEEREVRRVRQWVDREVIPIAAGYWDRVEFPFEIIPEAQ